MFSIRKVAAGMVKRGFARYLRSKYTSLMTDRMWKLNKKEKSVASKTNLVNVTG